jgi:hypothetical protein
MGKLAKQLNLMNSLFHPPCKNRVKWHLLEFIIKDNVGFGEWDWEVLNLDWDSHDLEEWGLDLPKIKDDVTDLSDSLETSLKIEVDCTSEEQQETLFNELIEQGYECRLLTL